MVAVHDVGVVTWSCQSRDVSTSSRSVSTSRAALVEVSDDGFVRHQSVMSPCVLLVPDSTAPLALEPQMLQMLHPLPSSS
jgi:hypothetical protein